MLRGDLESRRNRVRRGKSLGNLSRAYLESVQIIAFDGPFGVFTYVFSDSSEFCSLVRCLQMSIG